MPTDSQDASKIRTSQTHPLKIATLHVGECGGAVGVTFAPGKHQAVAMTGIWQRDLATDLNAIKEWGATDLVTMLEPHEFEELKITDLPQQASDLGLRWHGLPIVDGASPDSRFLAPWETLGPKLVVGILSGDRVVVHCKGGLGRAGTVACMLLLAAGGASSANEAITKVRAVRHGAIETIAQENFLRSWESFSMGRS